MSVLERIFLDFPQVDYIVEIIVLDGAGNPFRVYGGEVEDLREQHFEKCFRNSGCFYVVRCLGMKKQLLDSPDLHFRDIQRIEFVWLTRPKAPYLIASDDTSATLAWEECLYCGFSGEDVDPEAIQYILEIAEGHPAKNVGVAARYASDTDVEDRYIKVCARFKKGEIEITDLKGATWYHARNVVKLHGIRHVSKPTTFRTPSTVPSAPNCPRIYEVPNKSAENPSEERAPAVVLQWTAPNSNGADIQTYQVQFQETVLHDEPNFDAENYKIGDPLYINKAKKGDKKLDRDDISERPLWGWGGHVGWIENETKIKEVKMTMEKTQAKKNKDVMFAGEEQSQSRPLTAFTSVEDSDDWNIVTGKWTQIYNNLERKVKLSAPSTKSLEWKFRIRAKNRHGWSPFSPILYLHRKSHPSLFCLWFPSTAKVTPAESRATPNPLLSPDRNHDSAGLAVARKEYAISPIQNPRPSGMPLLTSSGYNNMMHHQQQLQHQQQHLAAGYGVPGMMYGMDTNLIMDGAGAGNGPRGISLPHVHGRYQNEQDIIENMPFSAGDSSALMSRQRPSSADSAESASMLDRRSSKESQKNRNGDYSPSSTPVDGARRKSAPPKQSANGSLFIE